MDIFGIGNALVGVVEEYFIGSRRTGRTTALIASVKTGDRIIFASAREADRVKKLLYEKGINGVDCVYLSPKSPNEIFHKGSSVGQTFFDHTWQEEFYKNALAHARRDLEFLQIKASGSKPTPGGST